MHDRRRPDQTPGQINVWAASASSVDLCLFGDVAAPRDEQRVPLIRNGDWWTSGDITLAVGQLYALRADGPSCGRAQFSPDRLLLDPYARAIGRLPDPLDPLAVVIDDHFDWSGDVAPAITRRDTVIYEAHVKGLTALHSDVAPDERGTFAGLASPPVIEHLRALGVTTVQLLPIHAHADEASLSTRGLTNYWGYNTLSFFAPDPRFSRHSSRHDPQAVVREFKQMVRDLHRAGLEVVLDVVFNHTAEGPLGGPTLSWRGLDPWHTYRWQDDTRTHYADRTGCGNTLNLDHPAIQTMLVDSLHYWVDEMRVDGFRFDLASALDRHPNDPGSLFRRLLDDPRLARTKLIVEPWDATGDGYRLGAFPAGIAEWNGRYRDAVRRFWRGDPATAAELATRLSGSDDLFGQPQRGPLDSINYVTAHDGFTLADVVSYASKHNEANGEHNADGEHQNFSSNAGVEGPSCDPAVASARATRQRSMLMTLFLSLGIPMLSGGDELGRTQMGNNNAYCQDNDTSWTHWPGDVELTRFVQRLVQLRKRLPHIARDKFLTPEEVSWLAPTGAQLKSADWQSPDLRGLGMRLTCAGHPDTLLLVNPLAESVTWHLPTDARWAIAISATAPNQLDDHRMAMAPCSALLLMAV